MLYKLLSHATEGHFAWEVVSLTDRGQMGDSIEALGVPLHTINMRRGVPSPTGLMRLAGLLRARQPSLIQTWMYHADLLGGLIGKLTSTAPIVWNLRASNLFWETDKNTFAVLKACAFVSAKIPTKIISCSEDALHFHARLGYQQEKIIVIPNGFDLTVYNIDFAARDNVRRELGLAPETPLIGLVARFNPYKDQHNFIQAAALLKREMPTVQFVLCGNGISWDTQELAQWITAAGLRDSFHLLGRRADVSRLTAAFDIVASSSMGEGFPNVLGEAMACGVPCVATNVGDSALIVGETGIIVPPKDPQALAAGWRKILTMSRAEREKLGLLARQRIEENFSLTAVVKRYENLYSELLASPPSKK